MSGWIIDHEEGISEYEEDYSPAPEVTGWHTRKFGEQKPGKAGRQLLTQMEQRLYPFGNVCGLFRHHWVRTTAVMLHGRLLSA